MSKYSSKLSGLNRVNWNNKTEKQKANYFKKAYTDLGLNIPKYILNGKMSEKQLQSSINKLTRSLQSRAKKETKRIKQERGRKIKIENKWADVEKVLNPINSRYINKIENQAISTNEKLLFITGSDIITKGGVNVVHSSIQTLSIDQLKTMYNNPKDALKFVNNSYKKQLEGFDLTKARNNLKKKVIDKTVELGSQLQSLAVNDKEIKEAINIVGMSDYYKLNRMIDYLDDQEYLTMVESLLQKGYVFAEALNLAYKNIEGAGV